MLVVLHHLGGAIAAPKYFSIPEFSIPFLFGHQSVLFFFVLSGFIIAYSHAADFNRPSAFGPYLRKRLLRIYPLYWMLFIAVYAVASLSLGTSAGLPHDWRLLLKALLLVPLDVDEVGGTGAPVLVVAWSLQYEIAFYMFAGLFILNRYVGCAALAALLLVFVSCVGGCRFPGQFFGSDFVLLFAIGVFGGLLTRRYSRIRGDALLASVSAGVLVVLAVVEIPWRGIASTVQHHLVQGLASGVLIVALAALERRGRTPLHNSFLTRLGDASYALYLMHYPIISVLCKLLVAIFPLGLYGALSAYALILLVCIASALLAHRWIERPLLAYLGSIFGSQGRRASVTAKGASH